MAEDEVVERQHQLSGHEFEQILENGDGQGSLVGCRPWVHDLATEEQQQADLPALEFHLACLSN